ncbi:hypothetical protein JCM9279_002072 [Rhodotorula babjevae]
MQSHDAPFQTGSASHSPVHAPPHHSPSALASFPDAPTVATASPASASPHHPPAPRMNRLSRSYSGSNSPAPLAALSQPPGAAHHAARPDREDASTSQRSPALSRHRSASTASDVPIPMARTISSSAAPSRADKGKGVARDGPLGQGHAPDDPDEQQRRVERVLQRAEASRLARAFRNRLALASYKASRGWHDVGLDTIEPHLEQEAQRRSQGPAADSKHPAPPPPAPQHYPSQPLAHQAYAPHPHQPVYQQQHPSPYDMDAVLGAPTPSSHPHKRARLDDPYQPARSRPAPQQQQQQQQADMYSAHSVYAPPPQPVHTVSPYSTASVYHREPAGPASARALYAPHPDDGAPSAGAAARKQRASAAAASSAAAAAAGAGSPSSPAGSSRSRRVPSRRSSPAKGSGGRPGDALSSSDPTFSSFVDAATALTGMARAPSDPSSQGSGSDEGGGAGAGARLAATRGMDVDVDGQGAGEAGEVGGGSDRGSRAPLARPATPERQIAKLDGAPIGLGAPGGGSAGANDSGTAEGAAELMLYLAASPSPVQSRKAPPTTLGDGPGIKGRRLFSGMGMSAGDDAPAPGAGPGQDPGSIFGGELGGAHPSGPLDAPFATSSAAPTSAPLEPVKSGGATSTPSGVFGGGGGAGPATPGRQRQPSLGGAASWELFINASPSPKRDGPNGGAGAAAGAGMGTRGASPPHAAIGA